MAKTRAPRRAGHLVDGWAVDSGVDGEERGTETAKSINACGDKTKIPNSTPRLVHNSLAKFVSLMFCI